MATGSKHTEVWMKVIDHKKIAKLLVIQDKSARQLAAAAGWSSHSYMNRILNGTAQTLKVEPACRIARYLGVGVDDLFLVQTSSEAGELRQHDKRAA